MSNTIVQQLQQAVQEAKSLLADKKGIYSQANRRALADMVERAEKALAGEKVPFTRNREFYQPREHEELYFAYDRFTMVSSFLEEGKVYNKYGLKESIDWFKKQDMSKWNESQLREGREALLTNSKRVLGKATYGTQIGQYDKDKGEALEAQVKVLENADVTAMASGIAKCSDALHIFLMSQTLYSEVEEFPILLLSEEKLEKMKDNIANSDILRKQYARVCEISDELSFEESRIAYEQIWNKYDYDELNGKFYIWGATERVVNTIAPLGTRGARLSFYMSGADNEEQGLGHVLINGIRLESAVGPEVSIPNAGFAERADSPEVQIPGWIVQVLKGSPVCKQIQTEHGEACLYVCNPTAADEARIVCDEILPLEENTGYTLFFRVKQDGKLKKGLEAKIEFLDANGDVIGEFVHMYNRKNGIPLGRKALDMQCSAVRYALDKDIQYAIKAKYDMLAFLNDFCQGAEYWMIHNARPEGSDAYGAVQAGRIMCSAASTYSLIAKAGVITAEEKKFMYQLVEYLLQYCLDLRDRISLSQERATRGSSNWQTDMCMGVFSLLMVLPDYPNRKAWMYNAATFLEGQMSVSLNADGSWPESLRYHHAALEHFASFMAMWKQETGEDWLLTTRIKDAFAFTIHTITPPYEYFGGKIGTPPFGDHKLGNGGEFNLYGLYIDAIAEVDKKLADEMYQVWKLAGFPLKGFWGEALTIESLLFASQENYQCDSENVLTLQSTTDYPESGIHVFRSRDHEDKENYLAVMASPKVIGHGHFDEGSFVLYHKNYPVIMDSGIEGYFDTSTQWHLCSYSHACLQFAATEEEKITKRKPDGVINLNAGNYSLDRGWLDVPRYCKVLETELGDREERIRIEITHPDGADRGIHHRTFIFDKQNGSVTIKDSIRNYKGKVLFSIPMLMKSAVIDNQIVHAQGHYPVNMDITFSSSVQKLYLESGRTTPMYPTEEAQSMLLYLRAEAMADEGIEVKITPYMS